MREGPQTQIVCFGKRGKKETMKRLIEIKKNRLRVIEQVTHCVDADAPPSRRGLAADGGGGGICAAFAPFPLDADVARVGREEEGGGTIPCETVSPLPERDFIGVFEDIIF